MTQTAPGARPDPGDLLASFLTVRNISREICAPLSAEDCVVQSMPDVSPMKWHLAHVTWFFETFILKVHVPDYVSEQPAFEYLFNSYYNAVGPQYPRPRRGLLTRPSLGEVMQYRHSVDQAMTALLDGDEDNGLDPALLELVEIGIQHEQQHQELMLMDIKHVLSCNPLYPAYVKRATWPRVASTSAMDWIEFPGGLQTIGHTGKGFSFDNEQPAHKVHLDPFRLASRPVVNGEYLDFIESGGYDQPEHWLADGWAMVASEQWRSPLYWTQRDGQWFEYSLGGLRPLDPSAPVCHVSLFEADAFASWAGARLPLEAEWETAAQAQPIRGNFFDDRLLHPRPLGGDPGERVRQLYGDVWEWTQSAYAPYPGFRKAAGALGEYNGKFMCNQYVLRGGCCATSRSHMRTTYRNFFYPHCRWQFAGIRLTKDL